MELRAGIIEGYWTPRAAKQATWAVAHLTPQESTELFDLIGNMTPSKSTLDRLPKALSALLKTPPHAYGWCRTRWSGATLAAQLKAKHGLDVSAWTVRRWLHELGWVWQRAKLRAKDDDPERVARLARIRFQREHLQPCEVLVFADELDIHLLPRRLSEKASVE